MYVVSYCDKMIIIIYFQAATVFVANAELYNYYFIAYSLYY